MINPKGVCSRMETIRNVPYLPSDNDSNIYNISVEDFASLNKMVELCISGKSDGNAYTNVQYAGGDQPDPTIGAGLPASQEA